MFPGVGGCGRECGVAAVANGSGASRGGGICLPGALEGVGLAGYPAQRNAASGIHATTMWYSHMTPPGGVGRPNNPAPMITAKRHNARNVMLRFISCAPETCSRRHSQLTISAEFADGLTSLDLEWDRAFIDFLGQGGRERSTSNAQRTNVQRGKLKGRGKVD